MVFEALTDLHQLVIDLRHEPAQRTDRLRITDAGDHVLALGIRQKLAVQVFFPGRRVARKHHACAGILTAIAKDHGLHVDRCAPVLGNPM